MRPVGPGPVVLALSAALVTACGSGTIDAADVFDGEVLTIAEADATHPTVAVDPRDGTVYIAWVGVTEGESNVYLARLDASGSPPRAGAGPVRVNDVPGDAAPHEQAPAQVRVGPEGEVYVVWQNNTIVPGRRFPASDLRFARSTDGGRSFEPAIYVNDDAGGPPASHTFHDLVVAPDGTIYVSWIDGRDPDRGSRIRVARSSDGGRSFGPSTVVDDEEACPCCRTALALGPRGELYIAWRKVFEGSIRDIVLARSTDGGRSFGPPVRVHEDDWDFEACPHAGPAVEVDDGGRIHVAWYTGAEGREGLWYATSDDAAARFSPPRPLLATGWAPPSLIRLALHEGRVWAAWDDRRDGDRRVVVATVPPAGRRIAARGDVKGTEIGRGSAPAVAVGGGVRAVVWLEDGAVRSRVSRDRGPAVGPNVAAGRYSSRSLKAGSFSPQGIDATRTRMITAIPISAAAGRWSPAWVRRR